MWAGFGQFSGEFIDGEAIEYCPEEERTPSEEVRGFERACNMDESDVE